METSEPTPHEDVLKKSGFGYCTQHSRPKCRECWVELLDMLGVKDVTP